MIFEVDFGCASMGHAVWKSDQVKHRVMVVHVNHAIARMACRSVCTNFGDLLTLCAYFQVDFMGGGDCNGFSYRYYKTGGQQIADSLQDLALAVLLRCFDEGINAQYRNPCENETEYQFTSDVCMTYRNEHIEQYRSKRDEIMSEVTDAAGESTKIPRLQ